MGHLKARKSDGGALLLTNSTCFRPAEKTSRALQHRANSFFCPFHFFPSFVDQIVDRYRHWRGADFRGGGGDRPGVHQWLLQLHPTASLWRSHLRAPWSFLRLQAKRIKKAGLFPFSILWISFTESRSFQNYRLPNQNLEKLSFKSLFESLFTLCARHFFLL